MKPLFRYGMLLLVMKIADPELWAQQSQDKAKPKLDLVYSYGGDGTSPVLSATVKARSENRYEPVGNLYVDFVMTTGDSEESLGSETTDSNGVARIEIHGSPRRIWDSVAVADFTAEAAESDHTRRVSKSITIKRARMRLSLTEEDSVRHLTAVIEEGQQGWTPAQGVDVRFIVKRSFGTLPASDELVPTDESGVAAIEFTADLPGDSLGRIELGGLVEDHEEYGTLSAVATAVWGIPATPPDNFPEQRALWASRSRAPVWLLVFPNLILLGVWSSIIYIVALLVRIRRISLK